jgi:hypothetical protein
VQRLVADVTALGGRVHDLVRGRGVDDVGNQLVVMVVDARAGELDGDANGRGRRLRSHAFRRQLAVRLAADLGETGPLSQGVQALRIRHINGMEVRKKRPRGFKKRPRGFK